MIVLKALIVAAVLWILLVVWLVRSGRLQLNAVCRRCGYTPSGLRDAATHAQECRGKAP